MSQSPSLSAEILKEATKLWRRVPGGHVMPIEGHSMRPLLRPGDAVFVEHSTANLRPGDIIVFWHHRTPVVHRLIRIVPSPGGPRFVPKGDNVARPDAPIDAGAIIGRVSRIKRGPRRIGLGTPVWRGASRLWATGQAALAGPGCSGPAQAAVVRRLMLVLSWSIFIPAQLADAVWQRLATGGHRNAS